MLSAASFADAQSHFTLLNFDAFKSELPAGDDDDPADCMDASPLSGSGGANTSLHLMDDSLNTPISNLMDAPIFFGPSVVFPPAAVHSPPRPGKSMS